MEQGMFRCKDYFNFVIVCALLAVISTVFSPAASAGFFDKLKENAEKLKQSVETASEIKDIISPEDEKQPPTPASQSQPKKPDQDVLKAQKALNNLGYNAGSADGFMGNKTRAAIIQFQQSASLSQTGKVGTILLKNLEQAEAKTKTESEVISMAGRAEAPVSSLPMPTNQERVKELYSSGQEQVAVESTQVGSSLNVKLIYKELPIFLNLPSVDRMESPEAQLSFHLIPSDRSHLVTEHEVINQIFDLVAGDLPNNYKPVSLAAISLSIGDFKLPMNLMAFKNYDGGGRGPAYVHYYLTSADSPHDGRFLVPFSTEIREQLKRAKRGTIEIKDSSNALLNTNGRIPWNVKDIVDYIAGFYQLQEIKEQKYKEYLADENEVKIQIVEYRRHNLPTELNNVVLVELDESKIPEPQSRVVDRVCYKALYPYYWSKQIAEFDSGPNHSSIQFNVTRRCINAKKVANDEKLACENDVSNGLAFPTNCDCVESKVFNFWDQSNKAERPISYNSNNTSLTIGRARILCNTDERVRNSIR